MGRSKLEKETNIIAILKQLRYQNAALKLILSKNQRNRVKERTRYLHVVPEKEQGSDDSEQSDFATQELESDPEEGFLKGEDMEKNMAGGGKPEFEIPKSPNDNKAVSTVISPQQIDVALSGDSAKKPMV